MSNYFDNQKKWSWSVDHEKGEVKVVTEHENPKPHTHTLDLSKVTLGEMYDNPGKVLGDAHRASEHEMEEGKEMSTFMERIRADQATIDRINQVGKNHAVQSQKKTSIKKDDGGRERGDEDGPAKTGRESGLKSGETNAAQPSGKTAPAATGHSNPGTGHSSAPSGMGSAASAGHSAGNGGHGSSGAASGGNAGHGGSGSGSGGSGGHGGSSGSGGGGGHGGEGGGGHGGH